MKKTGSSIKKLGRRPLIAVLVVTVLLIVSRVLGQGAPSAKPSAKPSASAAVSAQARTPAPSPTDPDAPIVRSEEDIAAVEDPMLLDEAGRHWLKEGKADLARKCFVASVKKHELNLYKGHAGKPWGDALVHERMGELDEAEAKWRKGFEVDVLHAYQELAHFSEHPKRKDLLEAANAHLDDVVTRAKAGEKAVIYVTSKGKPRYLKVYTFEEALEQFLLGERLRYAYIDKIDLSKKQWLKRVGCTRCVVEELIAYDADFDEQLDFSGFIRKNFHVGKKWKGKKNKSAFEPASRFNRLIIGNTVFLGNADFDSIKVTGRVLNAPMTTFMGEANFRTIHVNRTAEFRFAHFENPVSFKSAHFDGSAYFAYGKFNGLDMSRAVITKRPVHFASAIFHDDLLVEESQFRHGATFENATFEGNVTFRRNRFDAVLNMSRIVNKGNLTFRRNEAKDLLMYGGIIEGDAQFDSNVFLGRSRFALDELTRRQHLDGVDPLHKLYKLYQGDDDAEEDLTKQSQYGVKSVNDLATRFKGNVSFANTYFKQFAGFERVVFGSEGSEQLTNFYNAQFGGEAHFERARFYGIADFRTVGGAELSFNQARFHNHWMLDDANVPGRVSTTETDLMGDATVSIAGADIRSFGITYRQLLKDENKIWRVSEHRMFYEKCLHALRKGEDIKPFLDDLRLLDAKWDADGERKLTDENEILERAEDLCIGRTIDEYTRLRDSFSGRSMSDESDWAYWELKHYQNYSRKVQGGFWGFIIGFLEQMIFEKAFGWGVLLSNLLFTAAVVIFIFAVLMRLLCGEMEVEWDGEPTLYAELSPFALLVISMHSFLGGFGNAEHLVTNSTSTYKWLFTAEIMVGIIVITFFIGAYTRLVVSG